MSLNSLQIVDMLNFYSRSFVFTLHTDFPFDGFSLECCRSMVALYDVCSAPTTRTFTILLALLFILPPLIYYVRVRYCTFICMFLFQCTCRRIWRESSGSTSLSCCGPTCAFTARCSSATMRTAQAASTPTKWCVPTRRCLLSNCHWSVVKVGLFSTYGYGYGVCAA